MVKICFIIQNLNIGGAQRIFIDLINSLSKKKKYKIKLIIISNNQNILLNQISQQVDISILYKKKTLFSTFKIFKNIRNFNPDCVFSTITNVNLIMCFLNLFFLFKFKLIIREANVLSLNSKKDYYYIKFILVKILYPLSNKIICISNAVKIDLIDKYKIKKSKTVVIYNPIDYEMIQEKIQNKEKIFKINEFLNSKSLKSKKIIISIGKFAEQKGFDILINSMKYVTVKDAFLIIMGIGNKQKYHDLIKLNKLQNKIILLDYDTNPYVLLSNSSLYVCSSRYEGFGNTILEALYLGLPVISTPCHSGTNEIIRNLNYCEILDNFDSVEMGKSISNKLINYNFNKKNNFHSEIYSLNYVSEKYLNLI